MQVGSNPWRHAREPFPRRRGPSPRPPAPVPPPANGILLLEDATTIGRFTTLLEDTGLTEDAKGRIRRKLELWVDEDA